MNKICIIDFETYYNTAEKYDLKNISIAEYINDSRFEIMGLGVKMMLGDALETFWVPRDKVQTFLHAHDWKEYAIIAHNIKFDGAILAWKYGIKPKAWIDTKALAMAVLGSTVPSFNLKKLAEYFSLPPKGELNTNGKRILTFEEERELSEYCLNDVEICYQIYEKLMISFPRNELIIMDWTIRAFVEPKLVANKQLAKEIQQKIELKKSTILTNLDVDKKVFSSNPQFAEYLKSLGYELPMKKNPKGVLIPALAMGDPEFVAMTESSDKRLRTICLARKEAKQTMEIKRAEKLQGLGEYYPFDVIFSGATQTHRFSGGNGGGGNPQNFPKDSDLRACLEAPKGHRLLVGDFKNIELRILAFLSRDKELIDAIVNKKDVYAEFASKIYGRSITKQDEGERQFGKAAILGLGYGMGWTKFLKTVKLQGLDIDETMARDTVYLYRNTYKGVPKFWELCEKVLDIIGKKGYNLSSFPSQNFLKLKQHAIVLPSGLEIKFPNLRKEGREWVYDKFKSKVTEADKAKLYGGKLTENLCQALAGEICKDAIRQLIKFGYPPVGQVHDELLIISHNLDSEICLRLAMTARLAWWPELILDAEIGAGKNWKEAKEND